MVTMSVVGKLASMLSTIKFDDESLGEADEINNI